MNNTQAVYFASIEISNSRCFGKNEVLNLSDENGNWKKWTVILGDNATGKTTLLQAISVLEQIEDEEKEPFNEEPWFVSKIAKLKGYNSLFTTNPTYSKHIKIGTIKAHLLLPNLKDNYSIENENDKVLDSIYINFNSTGLNALTIQNKKYHKNLKVYSYGASRVMSTSTLSEKLSENSETIFNEDAKLINAEEWLLQLDYVASKDSEVKQYAIQKRELILKTLIDLLPGIDDIRFTVPTKVNLKSTLEFYSSYGYWLTIHQLSFGYKTMIAWMIDLAARMFERYPESNNPLSEPAIVLVDEIDLHLHPKWQRKIFEHLSENFPRTQFIVTAHSPLIVQAAPKDVNLVVLRKEGDHVVIDQDIENVHRWRIDQILTSDLFGIESARDPETSEWLEERKVLLQKETLSPKEKERLQTLNEKADNLPTADNADDIEAMEIIRKAAQYLKTQHT